MKKFLPTAACVLFMATSIAQAQVVVRIGPPARPVETIPPPPREHPGWAWRDGYHRWDGHAYVWVPGYYVEPPHPHAHWVGGHWDHRGDGYVWVEGHWR
jgi:hypothetical protein